MKSRMFRPLAVAVAIASLSGLLTFEIAGIERRRDSAASGRDATTLSPSQTNVLGLRIPGPLDEFTYEAESSRNTLEGGASVIRCGGCRAGGRVGSLGFGAKLTINGIQTRQPFGWYEVTVTYVSAEDRTATFQWYEDAAHTEWESRTVTFPNSGGVPRTVTTIVEFEEGESSVQDLKISKYNGLVPDIDSITLLDYQAEKAPCVAGSTLTVVDCATCSNGKRVSNISSPTGGYYPSGLRPGSLYVRFDVPTDGFYDIDIDYTAVSDRRAYIRYWSQLHPEAVQDAAEEFDEIKEWAEDGEGSYLPYNLSGFVDGKWSALGWLDFPSTGGADVVGGKRITLQLYRGENKINFMEYAPAYAPDIDKISLVEPAPEAPPGPFPIISLILPFPKWCLAEMKGEPYMDGPDESGDYSGEWYFEGSNTCTFPPAAMSVFMMSGTTISIGSIAELHADTKATHTRVGYVSSRRVIPSAIPVMALGFSDWKSPSTYRLTKSSSRFLRTA